MSLVGGRLVAALALERAPPGGGRGGREHQRPLHLGRALGDGVWHRVTLLYQHGWAELPSQISSGFFVFVCYNNFIFVIIYVDYGLC